MSITQDSKSHFISKGYCHLKGLLSDSFLAELNSEFKTLSVQASGILNEIQRSGLSYADYYAQGKASFITVPEAQNATQTCRFEYIQATSHLMAEKLVPMCARKIKQHIDLDVNLFKDKCNLKSPGGGAFTAHQDIPAYIDFGPTIHVTAAIFLDPATPENGALQMATNYTQVKGDGIKWQDTPVGQLPIFNTYQGGDKNGEILQQIAQQLSWKMIPADAGDIILFHSYVPHRSEMNLSNNTRRALFFTFNLCQDGDLYESYYQSKRADFGNLRFHIATPTRHKN